MDKMSNVFKQCEGNGCGSSREKPRHLQFLQSGMDGKIKATARPFAKCGSAQGFFWHASRKRSGDPARITIVSTNGISDDASDKMNCDGALS
jgi:hypothetical protein